MMASLANARCRAQGSQVRGVRPARLCQERASARRRPEYLVLIGICTHLGCLPKPRFDSRRCRSSAPNWPGGFFCPCHGSRFDLAGRVFEGSPASVNLRVPPYSFAGDHTSSSSAWTQAAERSGLMAQSPSLMRRCEPSERRCQSAAEAWIYKRLPVEEFVSNQLTGYYAPKNFNIWYFFGVAGAAWCW